MTNARDYVAWLVGFGEAIDKPTMEQWAKIINKARDVLKHAEQADAVRLPTPQPPHPMVGRYEVERQRQFMRDGYDFELQQLRQGAVVRLNDKFIVEKS